MTPHSLGSEVKCAAPFIHVQAQRSLSDALDEETRSPLASCACAYNPHARAASTANTVSTPCLLMIVYVMVTSRFPRLIPRDRAPGAGGNRHLPTVQGFINMSRRVRAARPTGRSSSDAEHLPVTMHYTRSACGSTPKADRIPVPRDSGRRGVFAHCDLPRGGGSPPRCSGDVGGIRGVSRVRRRGSRGSRGGGGRTYWDRWGLARVISTNTNTLIIMM